MVVAPSSSLADPRVEIVVQFVELISAHYASQTVQAAAAAKRLKQLGVTVHLEPHRKEPPK